MSGVEINILLVEDSQAEARLISEFLRGSTLESFDLKSVSRLADGVNWLQEESVDVVLLDLSLPDSQGLASLDTLLAMDPALPIVVLTNTNDEELAVQAVRHGAQDYLVKRQVNSTSLVRSIRYAIERRQVADSLREMNTNLSERIKDSTSKLVEIQAENQLKADFVSMISHDFRNPLNTILISTDLLQEVSQKGEDQLTYLRAIRSSIESLTSLLDEVSLLNKSEAGALTCRHEPLDLHQFCYQLVDDISLGIPDSYQLSYSHEGKFLPGLWDKTLLWHILINLITNAIKYSPAGGDIQLHVLNLADRVQFQVRDQGIGIPAQDLDQVFQPFFRGRNIGTLAGSGLGLTIVEKCAQACGGSCSAASELGQGTTITISLPRIFPLA
jgi:signal transduction histidine kinase